jgi:hypothetical protein
VLRAWLATFAREEKPVRVPALVALKCDAHAMAVRRGESMAKT